MSLKPREAGLVKVPRHAFTYNNTDVIYICFMRRIVLYFCIAYTTLIASCSTNISTCKLFHEIAFVFILKQLYFAPIFGGIYINTHVRASCI